MIKILVAPAAVLGLLPAPPVAAAAAPFDTFPATVRIIHADPADLDAVHVEVEGVEFTVPFGALAGPVELAPGSHPITVGNVSDTVEVEAGADYDVALVRPDGLLQPAELIVLERRATRVTAGTAGVRLVALDGDIATLTMALPPDGAVSVDRFAASQYEGVAPGASTWRFLTERSVEFLTLEARPEPDAFYSVFLMGGGETLPRAVTVLDARQAPEPPSPTTPIETGDGIPPGESPTWWWLGLAGLSAVATGTIACRRQRIGGSMPVVVILVVAALSVGCAGPGATPEVSSEPPIATSSAPRGAAPVDGSRPTSTATPTSGASATPKTGTVALPPDRLAIVAIGVDVGVIALPSGTVTVLTEKNVDGSAKYLPRGVAAWLDGTSAPGAIGTSVIIGHNTGTPSDPAAFAALAGTVAGDLVEVADANGQPMVFTVRSVAQYPKANLPADTYRPRSLPTLLLVTCAGDYTPSGRSHNTVVIATGPAVPAPPLDWPQSA